MKKIRHNQLFVWHSRLYILILSIIDYPYFIIDYSVPKQTNCMQKFKGISTFLPWLISLHNSEKPPHFRSLLENH